MEAWFSLAYLLANTIPNLAPLLLYFYSKRLDMTNKKTMTKTKTKTKTMTMTKTNTMTNTFRIYPQRAPPKSCHL